MFQPPQSENWEWFTHRGLCHVMRTERTASLLLHRMKKSMTQASRDKLGMGTRLRCAQTLTCGVVIEGVHVLLSAVASKEGFVVVILVPVEWLDLQPPALWVTTDDAGHSLVDLGGGAGAVHVGQKHHLLSHVTPALCTEQLSGVRQEKGEEREENPTLHFLNPKATSQSTPCLTSLWSPVAVSCRRRLSSICGAGTYSTWLLSYPKLGALPCTRLAHRRG